MGYATVSDVERLDSALTLTATSKPTASDVAGFLTDTAAELDAILSAQQYVVPVPTSAPVAFALLKRYNAVGGNALTQEAAPDSPHVKTALAAWDAAKKALKDGDVALPDADRETNLLRMRARVNASGMGTPALTLDMSL